MDRDSIGRLIGSTVHEIVKRRGDHAPSFLPSLLMGASFEGWLAFETRFALEEKREPLEMRPPRFWIGNEYKKVDLGLIEYATERHTSNDQWIAAVEFKVIYNNKNWESQVDGIHADLFPLLHDRDGKAAICGPEHQLAVVAIVTANVDGNRYQRPADTAPGWADGVSRKLIGGGKVLELYRSPEALSAHHSYLAEEDRVTFQVHVLAPMLDRTVQQLSSHTR